MNFIRKIILSIRCQRAISRSQRIEKRTVEAAKKAKRITELVTEIKYLIEELKKPENK